MPACSAAATARAPNPAAITVASAGVDLSDYRLRKKMGEEMAAALVSVKAGK